MEKIFVHDSRIAVEWAHLYASVSLCHRQETVIHANKHTAQILRASSRFGFLPVLRIHYFIIFFFLGIKNRLQRDADTCSKGHRKNVVVSRLELVSPHLPFSLYPLLGCGWGVMGSGGDYDKLENKLCAKEITIIQLEPLTCHGGNVARFSDFFTRSQQTGF